MNDNLMWLELPINTEGIQIETSTLAPFANVISRLARDGENIREPAATSKVIVPIVVCP